MMNIHKVDFAYTHNTHTWQPHTMDRYELRKGLAAGRIVWRWLRDMTGHIKRLDGNHLVGTGEEGYRTSGRVR